jgi:hypothetical protein
LSAVNIQLFTFEYFTDQKHGRWHGKELESPFIAHHRSIPLSFHLLFNLIFYKKQPIFVSAKEFREAMRQEVYFFMQNQGSLTQWDPL